MFARDRALTDFVVVDAAWPAAHARSVLENVASASVVVRDRSLKPPHTHYYWLPREEALQLLASASAQTAAAALELGRRTPCAAIDGGDLLEDPSQPHVVVEPWGLAGILAPATPPSRVTQRGGHRNTARSRLAAGPLTAATARRGAVRGPAKSLNGPPAPPMAAAPAPPLGLETASTPSEPLVTRYLEATLPRVIGLGETVSLLVWLRAQVATGEFAAALTQSLGSKLALIVSVGEGLSLVGPTEGTLEVSEPQAEQALHFKVKAERTGAATLQVIVFCEGAYLASLRVRSKIEERAPAQEGRVAQAARVQLVPRAPPDLSMCIYEQGDGLSFQLTSADHALYMSKFGPTRLASPPREHFRGFFGDIERMRIDTPEQRAITARKLAAKGANLFDTLFPDDLRQLLWELHDRIHTVQILSDEPWIPWEVCRLTRRNGQAVEDGPYFAEAFCVTRWLYGVSPVAELSLRDIALVVPQSSKLDHAPMEQKYMLSLASAERKVIDIPPTYLAVTQAMASGAHDAWHFTGHARADRTGDANQSQIELDDVPLTAEDLSGSVQNLLARRPFVFLNACQSAQAGLSLTGIGGWAQRFLRPGLAVPSASAFIGSYWSVYDAAANDFAQALYGALLSGQPIGEAGKAARAKARQSGDSSWLAYTVYADPHAKVV